MATDGTAGPPGFGFAEAPTAVRDAVQAADAGDLDAFLPAFTENGVVEDWDREFRGPAAIRRWSDSEFIGVQVRLRVTSVAVEDLSSRSQPTSAATASTGPATSPFTSTAPGS